MIKRAGLKTAIQRALRRSRVVALIGPRQAGKTTLAREFVDPSSSGYFDLEDPAALQQLAEPMTALKDLRGVVVIDEIQRRPDLFPILRVLADRRPLRARFLILGSASPDLLRQSSESLAGRIETIELSGLRLDEVGAAALPRLWQRGGFPLSYLARSETDSMRWRAAFVRTYLERDMPQLGIQTPSQTMLRFWKMLAHYHGNVWNASEPARSLGVSQPTVRRYLDILTDPFLVRQLSPWHENLKKRQVKSPKIYVRDPGLLHHLLGITTKRELMSHPKLGASWEGFAIEEALRVLEPDDAYFWATHAGAELDLLVFKRGKRIGIEVKWQDAPKITASMRIAMTDLDLDRLVVLYPGEREYRLADGIDVVPVSALASSDGRRLGTPRHRS